MVKTYGWLSPEKLKYINDNPKVVSLLYDLGLLPEEISARVRGYVEEETARLNLQNRELQERVGQLTDYIESVGLGLEMPPIRKVTEKR